MVSLRVLFSQYSICGEEASDQQADQLVAPAQALQRTEAHLYVQIVRYEERVFGAGAVRGVRPIPLARLHLEKRHAVTG